MKIIGLDGRTYTWNFKTKPKTKTSKLHQRARKIIHASLPNDIIYEEVILPGSKTLHHKKLRCDFFVPLQKLVIEVHGKQHFEFNNFHFNDKLDFGKAQTRDRDKEIWCGINNLLYIGLPYYESDADWAARIVGAYNYPTEATGM